MRAYVSIDMLECFWIWSNILNETKLLNARRRMRSEE